MDEAMSLPRRQDTREGYPYHGRSDVPSSLVHGTDTPRGYPDDGNGVVLLPFLHVEHILHLATLVDIVITSISGFAQYEDRLSRRLRQSLILLVG